MVAGSEWRDGVLCQFCLLWGVSLAWIFKICLKEEKSHSTCKVGHQGLFFVGFETLIPNILFSLPLTFPIKNKAPHVWLIKAFSSPDFPRYFTSLTDGCPQLAWCSMAGAAPPITDGSLVRSANCKGIRINQADLKLDETVSKSILANSESKWALFL